LASAVFGFDVFVVAGANGSVHTSTNQLTWANHVSGSSQHLGGIAYGRSRFVAGGAGGAPPGSPAGTPIGGDIVRSGEYPSADLTSLVCSAGALSPAFDPAITVYGSSLARTGATATVTAVSEDPLAKIRVRFKSGGDVLVASGAPSPAGQILGYRGHTFIVTVTSRNNVTKVYAVSVSRTLPKLIEWIASWWPIR
jgi:hypothetical protein